MKIVLLTILALVLGGGFTPAGTPISEVHPVAPDGEVSVELISGKLTIVGWNRDEVSIEGTLGDKVEKVDVDSDDGDLSIEVELEEGRIDGKEGYSELEIRVPVGSSLEIEAVAVAIDISGIKGEVEIESVSGPVTITGPTGPVDIEAVSGNVLIEGGSGDSSVESAAGNVNLTDRSGDVDIEIVSGNLTIRGGVVTAGSLESVNGTILFEGDLASGGDLDIESVNGSVVLMLAADISAEFHVETFSGDIESDFGEMRIEKEEFIPAKEATFTTGTGSSHINVETFNGNVEIRKR